MEQATFGPYRILELLGRGGMGEVYRAHDSETDRVVALKLLRAPLAVDEEYAARFRRECRSAARLNEAHVIPIHRFGEIDGRLYLDMRLVDGTDLGTWLRRHGPLAPDVAVAVVGQVAQALDAAHAAGLVHRDVKPSNVMLAGAHDDPLDAATVVVYLLDFGITRPRTGAVGADVAVLTRAGDVPGSPSYIAPERLSGVEGDPRADVYSLACALHEALAGSPPFGGDLPALIGAHLRRPPPRPSTVRPGVPGGFDAVVATGMAKEPDRRYATAGALAAAARAVLTATGPARAAPEGAETVRQTPGADRPPDEATRPADTVTVRFGPGIADSGATTVPSERGESRVATQPRERAGRSTSRRRGGRRHLLGGLVTALVVAAALLYLYQTRAAPLTVVEARVAPAAEPGQACDVTVDVVGTVRTNGNPGTITYEWTRSDGETAGPLTETVADGTDGIDVHLLWTLSGSGRYLATATLRVLEPNPVQAEGSFTYDCP
jgi:serine/threonine-protein kinase